MLIRLEQFIRQHRLIDKGERIICAVSGGADSMALLWGLYLLREKLGIQLEVAHFNHGLRGAESDGDATFVEAFCKDYQIRVHMHGGQVMTGKKGLEAAARDARYAFFQTLDGKVATAHTADDNAETVLMHLVRGTGLKGLGGITPHRGKIIRPMLSVTRHQVLDFLQEYHIPYREDSSNHSDQFLRNRLRHHVMPLLKVENPRLAENLSAMALRLREDEEALVMLSGDDELPAVPKLRQLPSALRNRVLERFLKKNGITEPEAEHIALANALVFSEKPSASAAFPGGVIIRRCYDQLVCCVSEQLPKTVQLSCPGEVRFGKYQIVCTPAESVVNVQRVFTVTGGTNITVRSRRSGDRLTLSGGTGTVKKLMIDRKIPAHKRSFLPVLEDEQGIIAVCDLGAQIDRRAACLPGWMITITEIE